MMIPDIFPKLATAYWIFRKVKGKHDLGTEGRERGYVLKIGFVIYIVRC